MGVWDRKGEGAVLWSVLLSIEADIEQNSSIEQLRGMQIAYFKSNIGMYSIDETEFINQKLDAVLDKFKSFSFWLEQIWRLSRAHKDRIHESGEPIELTEYEQFILRTYLNAFLFESRAFMDFIMYYALLVLKSSVSPKTHMTRKVFRSELRTIQNEPFSTKARRLEHLFEKHKLLDEDSDSWFGLLRSLRDRIAHRDYLRESFAGHETLMSLQGQHLKHISFDWLTINGMTYDRLCQGFQNEIFVLLEESAPLLFDIKWQPGPYIPGMFGE